MHIILMSIPLSFIFAIMKKTNYQILLSTAIILMVLLISSCNRDIDIPDTIEDNPEVSRVFVNDKEFHVETFGNPVNPTVIIIHGGPGWDYTYMMPLANLSDQYFVVFYDQSGCGLSPRYDSDELNIANALEDLHGIVRHYCNDKRVNLIGHGYGAMLASAYIGQHPDRVAYTVLAEPLSLAAGIPDSTVIKYNPLVTDFGSRKTNLTATDHEKPDSKYLSRLREKSLFPATATCNPESWPGTFVQRPGAVAAEAITKTFYSHERGYFVDFTVGNERFKNSVMLLFSECNPYFNEKHKKLLQQSLDRAIYKTINGTGHLMFDDNPLSSVAFIRGYFNNTNMIRSNKGFTFN